MRTNTCITLLLAISTFSFSQSVDFPDSVAVWSVHEEIICGDNSMPNLPPYHGVRCSNYLMVGDTIIDSTNYSSVYLHQEFFAGVRSDSTRKVFVYLADSSKEFLIYDFDIDKGDTSYITYPYSPFNPLDTIEVICTKVDTVFSFGLMRRELTVKLDRTNSRYDYAWWIEGIGSDVGLFYGELYSNFGKTNTCADCRFLEYFYLDTDTSWLECEDSCWHVGIEELNEQINKPSIYPTNMNNSESLVIQWENTKDFQVQIFDLSGREVFQQDYRNQAQISIPPILDTRGIYLVRVRNEAATYSTKIIVH